MVWPVEIANLAFSTFSPQLPNRHFIPFSLKMNNLRLPLTSPVFAGHYWLAENRLNIQRFRQLKFQSQQYRCQQLVLLQ
jgi:hypothetical protein